MTKDEMRERVEFITSDDADFVAATYAYAGWEEDAKAALELKRQSREMKTFNIHRLTAEVCRRLLAGEVDAETREMLLLAVDES